LSSSPTESTPIGKVLGLLLRAIEPDLKDEAGLFEKLDKKLNRGKDAHGNDVDERLEAVKIIEATILKNVRENFRSVKLEMRIPPPEMKTDGSRQRALQDRRPRSGHDRNER
jgi:hypothetical protein